MRGTINQHEVSDNQENGYLAISLVVVLVLLGILVYFAMPAPNQTGGQNGNVEQKICEFTIGIMTRPMACDLRDFFQGIAVDLIAVGFIFLVGYVPLKSKEANNNRYVATLLSSEMEKKLTHFAGIHEKFAKSGITNYYEQLIEVKAIAIRLHSSDIKIMTTWFTDLEGLRDIFRKAAKNKKRIQILLLDPSSGMAEQRSRDLGDAPGTVPYHIQACRTQIEKLNLPGIKIKYYNALPSFPLYIFGNNAFFGVFPHGLWADQGPWLHVQLQDPDNNSTAVGGFLIDEFEKVWAIARDIKEWDQQQSSISKNNTGSAPS
jgi:hypothetical protein